MHGMQRDSQPARARTSAPAAVPILAVVCFFPVGRSWPDRRGLLDSARIVGLWFDGLRVEHGSRHLLRRPCRRERRLWRGFGADRASAPLVCSDGARAGGDGDHLAAPLRSSRRRFRPDLSRVRHPRRARRHRARCSGSARALPTGVSNGGNATDLLPAVRRHRARDRTDGGLPLRPQHPGRCHRCRAVRIRPAAPSRNPRHPLARRWARDRRRWSWRPPRSNLGRAAMGRACGLHSARWR